MGLSILQWRGDGKEFTKSYEDREGFLVLIKMLFYLSKMNIKNEKTIKYLQQGIKYFIEDNYILETYYISKLINIPNDFLFCFCLCLSLIEFTTVNIVALKTVKSSPNPITGVISRIRSIGEIK
jgi:hypothetical protein